MDNIRDALLRMVEAFNRMNRMNDVLVSVGFGDNPLIDIECCLEEAILKLVGTSGKENYEDTEVYNILHTSSLTKDRAAELLMNEYLKNTQQPAPHTFERAEMRELFEKNGGYMTPEGEWK